VKQLNTKAILLKRMNYGEADRIITVLTPDQGKISILAKGSRRSKSKLAGGLELFSVTHLSYIDGRSDLKTVIGTQLETYYSNIVKDMPSTMAAYDFLKLVDTYTQETCDESYFMLLMEGLAALNDSDTPVGHTQAWFLMHLQMISGHGLNIDRDLSGNSFSEDKIYHFSYDDMCFFDHKAGTYTPRHIKLLMLLSKISKPAHLLKVQDADHLIEDILPLLQQCSR
jgi:DNA repair protein RecO